MESDDSPVERDNFYFTGPESHRIALGQLSLEEITDQFSATGLQRRFIMEVDAIGYDPETRTQIDDALDIALMAHEGDMHRQHAYAAHFLRVSTRAIHHMRVTDPTIVIAALLHDTVEDHPERLLRGTEAEDRPGNSQDRNDALAYLARRFNPEVAELVAAVTNPLFDPQRDKNTQYREHVVTSLENSPKARIIKLSDFLDNYGGLKHCETPARALRLAQKYWPLVPDMYRFALDEATPLDDDGRAYVVSQLQSSTHYCSSLFARYMPSSGAQQTKKAS